MQFSNKVILTKIRAMNGRLLTKKEYFEIINYKNITEILSYLKNNIEYKKIFEKLDYKNFDDFNKEEIKNILRKNALNSYAKIYKYDSKNKILNLIIEYFETNEILKTILLISTNSTKEYIPDISEYFISKCSIKILKFSEINNFEELIAILKKSKYNKILKRLKIEDFKNNYSKCEYIFYLNLFKKILKTIESKAKNVEMFELKKLIKNKIENINLNYIYRKKFNFNESDKEIKNRIFPFNKKLTLNKINQILNCKTKDQLKEIVENYFPKSKNFKIDEIEKFSKEKEYIMCKHNLSLSLNVTTVFYCFFILKQIEISNLFTIIDGIYYKLKKEEIKNFLIA